MTTTIQQRHDPTKSSKNTSEKPLQNESPLPYIFDVDGRANMKVPVEAEITGKIPAWLKGSLFRNGSGLYKLGDTTWKHFFDGFSVLHRWTIQDGKVSFLSRILDSDHYKKCVALNRIVGIGVGSHFPDPCKSIFKQFVSHYIPTPPDATDNTAVNIVEIGDRFFALTETTTINEIDPTELSRIRKTEVADHIAVHMGTAHPHFEKDGTMLYFGTNMKYWQAYNIIRATPPKSNKEPVIDGEIVATIPSRWKLSIAYNHSFGVTENYIIFMELPYAMNLRKSLTMNRNLTSLSECMEPFPDENILLHVVDKKTGKHHPIVYEAPHGFVFHFINCYEEMGHIVVDVCLNDTTSAIQDLYLESLIKDNYRQTQSYYARYVLPLDVDGAQIGDNVNNLSGSQAKAVLTKDSVVDVEPELTFGKSLNFDLPRINYNSNNGLKYRYVYGCSCFTPDKINKIVKLDLKEKTSKEWICGNNYVVGEPAFIPHPDSSREDEGVVLCPLASMVSDEQSFLVVLDAETFEELATASLPRDVQLSVSIHGTFSSKVSF